MTNFYSKILVYQKIVLYLHIQKTHNYKPIKFTDMTLKNLQKEVYYLQRELEMRTALCALIPEKYAMCFKPTRIDSGYSMGEDIYYICNGKEIYREDYRKYYTGRGAKYNPTHGHIFIEFTKKALLEYCKLCYNIRYLKDSVELAEKKRELLKKCISTGSKVKEIYIAL